MRVKSSLLLSIVLLYAFIGCTPKVVSQSDTDSPERNYQRGVRNLEDKNYSGALQAFQRSVGLDKKFAKGWAGLGLTQAYLNNFSEGKKSVDKAVDLASKDATMLVYRGRYWSVNRGEKDWLQNAEKNFRRALKLDPGNESAEYYLGEAYFYSLNFQQAGTQFGKVVKGRGALAGKATEKWSIAQDIDRASPGTVEGKKVAIKEEINKADLVVLFAEELKATEIIKKFASSPGQAVYQPPGTLDPGKRMIIPPDVAGTWVESWVTEILDLGLLEVDPSGNFLPDKPITRSEFAMAVVRLLSVVTRDATLDTKYMGESPSRFSDVSSSNFAYSAMVICAERGFMKVEGGIMSTRFNPAGGVSGAKALLTIREFQNSLKMPF